MKTRHISITNLIRLALKNYTNNGSSQAPFQSHMLSFLMLIRVVYMTTTAHFRVKTLHQLAWLFSVELYVRRSLLLNLERLAIKQAVAYFQMLYSLLDERNFISSSTEVRIRNLLNTSRKIRIVSQTRWHKPWNLPNTRLQVICEQGRTDG
jgi:hypothetical protein